MRNQSHSDLGSDTRTCTFRLGDNFPNGGVVYFLEAAEKIKIGHTRDLRGRFIDLDAASPVELKILGWVEGTQSLERALHRLVAEHRAKGEWFHDHAEVRSVITRAMAGDISELINESKSRSRVVNAKVVWASTALRQIAHPLTREDTISTIIDRVASRAGLTYWRAFDIWYAKARRLDANEAQKIQAAIERETD